MEVFQVFFNFLLFFYLYEFLELLKYSNIVSTPSTSAQLTTIDSTKQERKKERTSPIWQYFKQINESIMKCTICDKQLKITKTSKSTLRRHLEKIHNLIF